MSNVKPEVIRKIMDILYDADLSYSISYVPDSGARSYHIYISDEDDSDE